MKNLFFAISVLFCGLSLSLPAQAKAKPKAAIELQTFEEKLSAQAQSSELSQIREFQTAKSGELSANAFLIYDPKQGQSYVKVTAMGADEHGSSVKFIELQNFKVGTDQPLWVNHIKSIKIEAADADETVIALTVEPDGLSGLAEIRIACEMKPLKAKARARYRTLGSDFKIKITSPKQ